MHGLTRPLLGFVLLLLVPMPVLAAGYAVEASSYNWVAQRDYSAANVADGDPATTWCEGATGEGVGEWLAFSFDAPIKLAGLAVRNGDQREGSWETSNRVKDIRIDYGHGRQKIMTLANESGEQFVELAAEGVDKLTLTILSTYPADNFWNRTVTCVSEVGVSAFMSEAEAAEAQAQAESAAAERAEAERDAARAAVVLPKVELPESLADTPAVATEPATEAASEPSTVADAADKTAEPVPSTTLPITDKELDWKAALPRQEGEQAAATEDATGPALALKQVGEAAPPAAESVNAPAADAAAAEDVVREYYRRLNTLDPTFPELMAAEVYDQELLSFLYFEEIQKQLGTADRLRRADVDLNDLVVKAAEVTDASAEVAVSGAYVIATPGQKLMVDENSRFRLVLEQGGWKIEKKLEED